MKKQQYSGMCISGPKHGQQVATTIPCFQVPEIPPVKITWENNPVIKPLRYQIHTYEFRTIAMKVAPGIRIYREAFFIGTLNDIGISIAYSATFYGPGF